MDADTELWPISDLHKPFFKEQNKAVWRTFGKIFPWGFLPPHYHYCQFGSETEKFKTFQVVTVNS